jgi:hypothetical protein
MVDRGRARYSTGIRGPHKPEQAEEAWRLRYEEQLQVIDIARILGRHRSTIMRWTKC